MKSFKTHILENKDHVETHFDIMLPKKHDDPKKGKAYVQNLVKKKGGPSVRVTSYDHDGPGGGHPAVSIKGRVDHVMKYHNHHNDEKYSTDHAGHKKMSKDYGFSESATNFKEISFRPHDTTSLGTKYANKVGRGDYGNKKIDNRKKGIAMLTKKRMAALGAPTAKVPATK